MRSTLKIIQETKQQSLVRTSIAFLMKRSFKIKRQIQLKTDRHYRHTLYEYCNKNESRQCSDNLLRNGSYNRGKNAGQR